MTFENSRRGARWALGLALACGSAPALAGPLSEDEAVRRALAVPAATARDEAQQAEAQANAEAVRRFDNPELTTSRDRTSGTLGSETEWHVGVSQPIELSGARGSTRAAAAAEAQAVDQDITRRRERRITDTRIAWAQCSAAQDRLTVLSDHAAKLDRIERAIDHRTKAGDAAGYDLRRVRIEVRSVEAKKAVAAGEVAAACAPLSALTGEPDARASGSISLRDPNVTDGSLDRPDLDARRHRLTAADKQAEAARRRQLPEVRLGLGYKRIEEGGASAGGATVSLGVRLPLFGNGGAERRAAEARRDALDAELALAQADAEAEVRAAGARADAAFDAAFIATRGAEDALRITQTAEAAYQGGEIGITELIDGYRASSEARLLAIDMTERAAIAAAEYQFAKGGMIP